MLYIFKIKITAITISVVIFLFLFSCKKEEKLPEPLVTFESPVEYTYYSVPGVIPVKIEVNAFEIIKTIRICLVDANQTQVNAPVFYYPGLSSIHLDFNYIVSEPLLFNLGPYYLQVMVNTEQQNFYYLKLTIENKPLQYKGLYVTTRPTVNMSSISFVDANLNGYPQFIINKDVVGTQFSGLLYLHLKNPDELVALNYEDDQTYWSFFPNADYPFISTFTVKDNTIYIGAENGRIAALNCKTGSVILTTQVFTDTLALKIGISESYFFAELKPKNGTQHALTVFYSATGFKRHSIAIDFEVIDFYNITIDKEIAIVGNFAEKGYLYNYFLQENYFYYHTIPLSGGPVSCSTKAEGSNIVYSCDKDIYTVNIENQISTKLISMPEKIIKMTFNHIDRQLVVATSSSVCFLSYPGGQQLKTYTPGEKIKSFDLLFGYENSNNGKE